MKNRAIFFVVSLLLLNMVGFAQQKITDISFDKEMHQMGTVKEEAGDVNFEFEFTNTGINNLIIKEVKTDAGIELISWPQESIIPGAQGYIVAVFHAKGNPGRVNKKIRVFSNTTTTVKVLNLFGNVTPIPNSIADKYRRTLGNTSLRLKSTYLSVGNVTNKQEKAQSIKMINAGESVMKLSTKNVPKFITVKFSPEELKPNEEGTISVTYNAGLNKNTDGSQKWGAQNDRFYIVINDNAKGANRNSISVRASIEEDFNSLSPEELAKAPKIEFKSMTFDFGTINQGDVITHDFVYTNVGENDLEIRHVKAS